MNYGEINMEVLTLILAILLIGLATRWTYCVLTKSQLSSFGSVLDESSSRPQILHPKSSQESTIKIIECSILETNKILNEFGTIYLNQSCKEGIESIRTEVENIHQQIQHFDQIFAKYKIDTLIKILNFKIKDSEKIIKLIDQGAKNEKFN